MKPLRVLGFDLFQRHVPHFSLPAKLTTSREVSATPARTKYRGDVHQFWSRFNRVCRVLNFAAPRVSRFIFSNFDLRFPHGPGHA